MKQAFKQTKQLFPQEGLRAVANVLYEICACTEAKNGLVKLKSITQSEDFKKTQQIIKNLRALNPDSETPSQDLLELLSNAVLGTALNSTRYGTSKQYVKNITNSNFERQHLAKIKRAVTSSINGVIYKECSIKIKVVDFDDDGNGNDNKGGSDGKNSKKSKDLTVNTSDSTNVPSNSSNNDSSSATTSPTNNSINNNSVDDSSNDATITNDENNITNDARILHNQSTEKSYETSETTYDTQVQDSDALQSSEASSEELIEKAVHIVKKTGVNFATDNFSSDMSDETFEQILKIDINRYQDIQLNEQKLRDQILETISNDPECQATTETLRKIFENKSDIQKLNLLDRRKSKTDIKALNQRIKREARRMAWYKEGKIIEKLTLTEARSILHKHRTPENYYDEEIYDVNYEFREETLWDLTKQKVRKIYTFTNAEDCLPTALKKRFIHAVDNENYKQMMVHLVILNYKKSAKRFEKKIKKPQKKLKITINQIQVMPVIKKQSDYKILFYEDLKKILVEIFSDPTTELFYDNLDHNWEPEDIKRKNLENKFYIQKMQEFYETRFIESEIGYW